MALNNLPVVLSGFRLMVSEPVTMKMRREKNGAEVPVTDRDGNPQYVVAVFAKPRRNEDGSRGGRGEEIRVTLPVAPGEAFEEGEFVELVNPRVSFYEVTDSDSGRRSAGLAYKADSLAPAVSRAA